MHTTPREVFALELQDDAMAPDFPAGTIMRLDPSKAPRAGWPALVRDAHGHHYLRDYMMGAGGHWIATPRSRGYEHLHAAEHGLQVIAIMIGVDYVLD